MADECTLLVETHPPVPMTVSNTTGIEKGAILKLTDPNTAALADGDDDIIAGIAAEEKIASDGKTTLAVYRRGIFKGLAGGAITIGCALGTYASTGATNELHALGAAGDNMLGESMETADDGHTFRFELKPMKRDMA